MAILERLRLKNFLIHEDLEVLFTKGLNVIFGHGNKGKSTIFRALRLLYMNDPPRGAEKRFQNWSTDVPFEIESIDSNGQRLKRVGDRYFINDIPLKAFKNAPQDITTLFPIRLKDANFQNQHDKHFLIWETGGSVSKKFSAIMNMEERELLIKEIRSESTDINAEIKNLVKLNSECERTIERLKCVDDIMEDAMKLEKIHNHALELKSRIDLLFTCIFRLEKCETEKNKFDKLKDILIQFKGLKSFNESRMELKKRISNLEYAIECMEKCEKIIVKYNVVAIDELRADIAKLEKLRRKTIDVRFFMHSLEKIIIQVDKLEKRKIFVEADLKRTKEKFESEMKKLGYCPFCKQKYTGGHFKCKTEQS